MHMIISNNHRHTQIKCQLIHCIRTNLVVQLILVSNYSLQGAL